MIERMDTSEKKPFTPVHVAELIVPPDDVEMSLGVCLKHGCNQPFTERFDIREQLLSCSIRWSLLKLIIHIRRLLAALNHPADRPFVDGCNSTNMRQDISRRPFPVFWRCAKGGVRDGSSCCQKLVVRLSQRFDVGA